MHVKTQFSIKDLENLSGIKAHTIRIWEKRYNLLEPTRTDTNIRKYDLENLKKLLNVTFLYNQGHKISKIVKLEDWEVKGLILGISEREPEAHAFKAFKTSMFEFDTVLFCRTFEDLLKRKTFRAVFFDVLLPLLTEIGTLWHTGTIDPSHESFISELIKQKITFKAVQELYHDVSREKHVFVLYLPYEEIHEIGLLYCNYEILKAGLRTIYLGNNMPLSSLKHIAKHHSHLTFVTYFTVQPTNSSIHEYIDTLNNEVLESHNFDLWLLGSKTKELNSSHQIPENVKVLGEIEKFIEKIDTLNKS